MEMQAGELGEEFIQKSAEMFLGQLAVFALEQLFARGGARWRFRTNGAELVRQVYSGIGCATRPS